MTIYKNISGTWTQMSDIYANNGSWQLCKSVWRNVSGTWQCIHVGGYSLFLSGSAGGTGYNTYVDKYALVNDGVVAGTSLSIQKASLSASGNQLVCIFGAGMITGGTNVYSTEKYTYSSNGVASGTNLGLIRSYPASVCTQPGGFANA